MTQTHPFEIFANETPTEVHAEGCEHTPESYATGDAKAAFVENPDGWLDDDERVCRCCPCLDDVLGRDA